MSAYDRVVLRRFRDGGDIIALFPDEQFREPNGNVNSYMTVGQHGEASWPSVIEQTTAVRPGEPGADDLLAELRRIGYNPLQLIRRPRR